MNEELLSNFKQKLSDGKPVFCPFMKTCDPAFVEAAGYANMDFAILDMEHGPGNIENMQNNIRAAQLSGILPIVRVSSLTEEAAGRALDIGAAGVEIPQITNAQQAEKAVNMAKFYPKGERGACRFVRAAKYSHTERERYFENANNTLVIIQLEGAEAIKNLDEIFKVKGIDIIFIGPYDLSQSLGVPGQTTHPLVINAMKSIIEKAKKNGITIGTFTDSDETVKMWLESGVQYISYSVDVGIFYESCRHLVHKFHTIYK